MTTIAVSSLDGKRKLRALSKLVLTNKKAITSNDKKQVFNGMLPLDFYYFFFNFLICNKTVYEKCRTSRNVFRNVYFENSVLHSCIFSYQVEPFNRCYDKLCTRDHPLSTNAKFSEKLTFLTPWYAHISVLEMLVG